MQFETQRLLIRPWKPALDARHALDIYGDRQVMAWIDGGSRDLSIRQVQGRLQRYADPRTDNIVGSWAVEQKDIGRVIGSVMLVKLPDLQNTKPTMDSWAALRQEPSDEDVEIEYLDGMATNYIEIGWHFRPASWGFGYATEAARRVCQHAFEDLKLPTLLAVSAPENTRSVAVMERLGMRNEGLTTRYYGGMPLALYQLDAAGCDASEGTPSGQSADHSSGHPAGDSANDRTTKSHSATVYAATDHSPSK
ncbi:MAG: GNAT family N-acetyltransferase [Phormidesmis sp.]